MKAANGACRVHLSSLEKSRKKAEAPLADAASAPAACTELADTLERDCFDAFARDATFSGACEQVFTMLNVGQSAFTKRLLEKAAADQRPVPDRAKRCEAALGAYRDLTRHP